MTAQPIDFSTTPRPGGLHLGPKASGATITFAALGVPSRLCTELSRSGISAPFPIQAAVLPDALAGRDVLGRGQTGSGKTLAFSIPLTARLAGGKRAAWSNSRSNKARRASMMQRYTRSGSGSVQWKHVNRVRSGRKQR